jgi:hypothetical protein
MSDTLLFNTIVEFFEEDEWDFQWMENTSFLMLDFSGKNGNWRCYAQAREPQRQVVFYSVLPVRAPESKRQAMAEFLTRANYGMVIGNFEMDFEDGEIRYKTSLDVEGAELLHPLLRQVVYANIVITDRYLPGIMRVLYSDATPQEVLLSIEGDSSASGEEATVDDDDLDDLDDDVSDEDFDDDFDSSDRSTPYNLN